MKYQQHVNPLNNDTTTIGCLHGLSTFTKLYTLTILDDCFSLTDLRVLVVEALYVVLNFVSFDQFQIKIFNFLVLFEASLLVLLIFVWAKYSTDIYERFLLNGWSDGELNETIRRPGVSSFFVRFSSWVFSFRFQTRSSMS